MRLNHLARHAGLAVGGALALALVAAPAAVAQETATVYVVHGVPDTPVDVYVDGKRAIDDFEPGTSQGRAWSRSPCPTCTARRPAFRPGRRPALPLTAAHRRGCSSPPSPA